jgi:hypothetical protein
MRDFRDLEVWQQSHQLTLEVYRVTEAFPACERFGLISQIRRACVHSDEFGGGVWSLGRRGYGSVCSDRHGIGERA